MAKIEYDKAKKVVNQASMKEQTNKSSTKKKLGRPIKDLEGATEKIMINVTPTQKEQIKKYIEKNNSTIAGLIKGLLKKENII
ncbi:MAG: Unknown protein [uncultured Campylobacterales bacterium]|uniref:Uncharacterized protein n=1 Tax=uncultured Campylobacterales bacterium TaxID=352960 RepID=A0A6S6T296_9BACT|nr:MAG: Unknown protein [uncultured Campylobacterales bacterium]